MSTLTDAQWAATSALAHADGLGDAAIAALAIGCPTHGNAGMDWDGAGVFCHPCHPLGHDCADCVTHGIPAAVRSDRQCDRCGERFRMGSGVCVCGRLWDDVTLTPSQIGHVVAEPDPYRPALGDVCARCRRPVERRSGRLVTATGVADAECYGPVQS